MGPRGYYWKNGELAHIGGMIILKVKMSRFQTLAENPICCAAKQKAAYDCILIYIFWCLNNIANITFQVSGNKLITVRGTFFGMETPNTTNPLSLKGNFTQGGKMLRMAHSLRTDKEACSLPNGDRENGEGAKLGLVNVLEDFSLIKGKSVSFQQDWTLND